MSIKLIKDGNIFDSKCQTLVNPVNCVGVMGTGLALKFKYEFLPDMYREYRTRCALGLLKPGKCYLWRDRILTGENVKSVLIFPTKDHFRNPSRLEWIIKGLEYIEWNYQGWEIKSIAFPALGCGLGGLMWKDVKPIMLECLSRMHLPIEIYGPKNII